MNTGTPIRTGAMIVATVFLASAAFAAVSSEKFAAKRVSTPSKAQKKAAPEMILDLQSGLLSFREGKKIYQARAGGGGKPYQLKLPASSGRPACTISYQYRNGTFKNIQAQCGRERLTVKSSFHPLLRAYFFAPASGTKRNAAMPLSTAIRLDCNPMTEQCTICKNCTPKKSVCGNGVQEGMEQCDGTDGVPAGGDWTCNKNCELVEINCVSDSILGAPSCDPNICTLFPWFCIPPDTSCGDGVVQPETETCDGTVGCRPDCHFCGDGVLQPGIEACDDGNSIDTDDCRNNCILPSCGDGIIDSGEECDDGNTNDTDECRNNCTQVCSGPTPELITAGIGFGYYLPSGAFTGNFHADIKEVTPVVAGPSVASLHLDVGDDGTWDIGPVLHTVPMIDPSTNSVYTAVWSNVWVPVVGSHRVRICADVNDDVQEVSETNNCASLTFNVPAIMAPSPDLPDITLRSFFYHVSPNDYLCASTSGSLITFITAVSQNFGSAASGTLESRLRIDTDNNGAWDIELTSTSPDPLTSGAIQYTSFLPSSLPPGNYQGEICADWNNILAESDESDNCINIRILAP